MQGAPSGSRFWLNEAGAYHVKRSGDPTADYSQSARVAYKPSINSQARRRSSPCTTTIWRTAPKSDTDWMTGLMDPGPSGGGAAPTTARPAYYQYQCRTNPAGGACPAYGQPGANP